MNVLEERIKKIIDLLPSTPDLIAEFLRKKGIRAGSNGYRNPSSSCPMAVYLWQFERAFMPSVTHDNIVFYELPGGQVGEVDFPEHVRGFVQNYDAGLYPDLKAQQ